MDTKKGSNEIEEDKVIKIRFPVIFNDIMDIIFIESADKMDFGYLETTKPITNEEINELGKLISTLKKKNKFDDIKNGMELKNGRKFIFIPG